VLVTVDGACYKGALPYPSFKALSSRSHVGGRHDPGGGGSGGGGGVLRGTGLRGRLGAVYLLDDFVKEEQMRALRARGPDYAGGSGGGGSVGLLDPAWEGSLLSTNRVMLLVHPARIRRGLSSPLLAVEKAEEEEEGGGGGAGLWREGLVEEEGSGHLSATTSGAGSFFDRGWDWRCRPVLEMVRAGEAEHQQLQLQPQPQSLLQQPALAGRGAVAVARASVVDALDCVGGAKVGGSSGVRGDRCFVDWVGWVKCHEGAEADTHDLVIVGNAGAPASVCAVGPAVRGGGGWSWSGRR
jgi:hypothetical protein